MTSRTIQIGYLDSQKIILSSEKMNIEMLLKKLWPCEVTTLDSLEGIPVDLDLVIITADHIPEEKFSDWLDYCQKAFQKNRMIWTPAIIISKLSLQMQIGLMTKIVKSNWYYDILSPDENHSIPTRAANLIRIHDHLKELYKYDTMLHDLKNQVEKLEAEILKHDP